MPIDVPNNDTREILDNCDDHGLIRLSQKGSQAAFRELVERYQERAFWVAHNVVHNREEATDVVQEAFIRVFKALGRFNFDYRFYTWLYQIVTNLSIDSLRRNKKRARVSIDDVGQIKGANSVALGNLQTEEFKARVRTIIDTLPEKYRIVMTLRDVEGMDSEEIAKVIGRTHSTVRWRLHKARQQFREIWEERFGPIDSSE